MADRAGAVSKARGTLLIQASAAELAATRTEVVGGMVEQQWESVRRFINDKQAKGRIRCLKLERMVDALIRGGSILAEVPDEHRQHGVADFTSLKRARIVCWIVKLDGTNKTRPVYGKWSLTPDDLLWSCQDNSDAPARIGVFTPGQIPHLRLVIFQNWVRDIHTDIEREAQIFDLLKLVSWKGLEYQGLQPFEIVGHDVVVNRDTLELYGQEVRDSFIVANAVRPHARQLNLVTPPDQRDVYEAAQDFIKNLGANLYRATDGAVMDGEGIVLYHVDPESIDAGADESTEADADDEEASLESWKAEEITGEVPTPEEMAAFIADDEDDEDEDDDDEYE